MTTTLLGANGKLGAILATYARLAGMDWRTQARSGCADVIWSGDVDAPNVDHVFQKDGTLINMIGSTGPDETRLQDTNVRFVKDLLHKAAEAGVAHVVLASSAANYGAGHGVPFIERDPLDPLTPYGMSKVAMETVANDFAARHAYPTITIVRIGNVAGADALMAAAKHHAAAGTAMPLHRFEDGTAPVRSYIGPRDFFQALHALSIPHDGPPRVVNVAHPQPVALDAVLKAYRAHVLPDLTWVDTPVPVGTIQSVTLATEKLQHFVKLKEYSDPADAFGHQVAEYLTQ